MSKLLKILTISVLAMFLFTGGASASYLADYENITIYDENGTGSGWQGGPHEDQEVEPGTYGHQRWDLEGFFTKDSELAMVGGYNFLRTDRYKSGDVFIDVDGDVVYGSNYGSPGGWNGVKDIDNVFGYDYVLDMDFGSMTYDVYAINENATLKSVSYRSLDESNPWRYKEGGTLLDGFEDLDILYEAGLSNYEIGGDLTGGSHNVATVNLAFLGPEVEFTSHFTYQCGNDNLMGYGVAPVPEPATMVLFGFGLIGLAGVGRKKFAK